MRSLDSLSGPIGAPGLLAVHAVAGEGSTHWKLGYWVSKQHHPVTNEFVAECIIGESSFLLSRTRAESKPKEAGEEEKKGSCGVKVSKEKACFCSEPSNLSVSARIAPLRRAEGGKKKCDLVFTFRTRKRCATRQRRWIVKLSVTLLLRIFFYLARALNRKYKETLNRSGDLDVVSIGFI